MKIANKMRMLAILPITLAVVVVGTAFFSARRIDEGQRQEHSAVNIVKDAYVLDMRAHEYLYLSDHGPERPRQQWLSKHKFLEQEIADMVALNDGDQGILDRMHAHHKKIDSLFGQIINKREELEQASGEDARFLEAQTQNLVRKLLQESQSFRDAVTELADSSRRGAQQNVRTANLLVLILVTATVLLLLLISGLTTRSITKPIARLHEGAEAIGRGNLGHRVATDAQDEVGELSRAFDKMAMDLQALMDQHQQDEAELRALNESLDEKVQTRTAELANSNQALKRSNAELEQFAYVVSHDLKEPLRGVTGFSQLLQKRCQGKLDESSDQHLTMIVDCAARMQRLIDDLLEYSQVRKEEKPPSPADLAKAFNLAIINLHGAVEESGAEVTCDELPTLQVNESQMIRLFQNLIGNAIYYRGDARCKVHVSCDAQDGGWLFSVRDNGIGIDSQHLETVFDVFRTLQPKDKDSGTGVGLAICKKIVEVHGGRIWAESEPGSGSVFYFTIPT